MLEHHDFRENRVSLVELIVINLDFLLRYWEYCYEMWVKKWCNSELWRNFTGLSDVDGLQNGMTVFYIC